MGMYLSVWNQNEESRKRNGYQELVMDGNNMFLLFYAKDGVGGCKSIGPDEAQEWINSNCDEKIDQSFPINNMESFIDHLERFGPLWGFRVERAVNFNEYWNGQKKPSKKGGKKK